MENKLEARLKPPHRQQQKTRTIWFFDQTTQDVMQLLGTLPEYCNSSQRNVDQGFTEDFYYWNEIKISCRWWSDCLSLAVMPPDAFNFDLSRFISRLRSKQWQLQMKTETTASQAWKRIASQARTNVAERVGYHRRDSGYLMVALF